MLTEEPALRQAKEPLLTRQMLCVTDRWDGRERGWCRCRRVDGWTIKHVNLHAHWRWREVFVWSVLYSVSICRFSFELRFTYDGRNFVVTNKMILKKYCTNISISN